MTWNNELVVEQPLWETPKVNEMELQEIESLADLDIVFAVVTWCTDFGI